MGRQRTKLERAITRFRANQADLFTSEALVERRVVRGAFDSSTGNHDPDVMATVYEGPCLIRAGTRSGTLAGSDVTTGERELRFLDLTAKFPVDTPVAKDDLITVTASAHDAAMVGVVLRITDVPLDEWQIARTVVCELTQVGPADEEESS